MDQLVTILGVVVVVIAIVFSHRDLEKKFRSEIAELKADINRDLVEIRAEMAEMRGDTRLLTAHILGVTPNVLVMPAKR